MMTNPFSLTWVYTSPGGEARTLSIFGFNLGSDNLANVHKASRMMTILLHKTWLYRTSPEVKALMLLPLWALLRMMPGISPNITSATTINTATPITITKDATLSNCQVADDCT